MRESTSFPPHVFFSTPKYVEWKNSRIFFMLHVDQNKHLYSSRARNIFSKYYFRGDILFLAANMSYRGVDINHAFVVFGLCTRRR